MKKILKSVIHMYLWIFSRLPFLSTTDDRNFHSISWGTDYSSDFRLSLLNIGLGTSKIYFLTIKEKKAKWFYVLKLEDVKKMPSSTEIEEKVQKYNGHLASITKEKIDSEMEFLKYRIDSEESIKNQAMSKIANYTAVSLVVFPIILTYGTKHVYQSKLFLDKILFIMILYCVLNIVLYIIEFLRVKSFTRSSFGELKDSGDTRRKLASSYYCDWYAMRNESPVFVTFVLKVERLYAWILMLVTIMIFLNFTMNIDGQSDKVDYGMLTRNKAYFSLQVESDVFRKEDLDKIISMQKVLLEKEIKEIIIIKKFEEDSINKEKYLSFVENIHMFNTKKANIIEVKVDEYKFNNVLEIILIGEEDE